MIGGVLDRGLPITRRGELERERRLPPVMIRVGERRPLPKILDINPGRLRLPSPSRMIGWEL
jgi:hypothetical protein